MGWYVRCARTLLSRPTHAGDAEAKGAILTVFSVLAVLGMGLKDAGSATKPPAKKDTSTRPTKRGGDSAEGSSNASKRSVPKSFLDSSYPRWEERLSMAISGSKKNEKLLICCLMTKKKN